MDLTIFRDIFRLIRCVLRFLWTTANMLIYVPTYFIYIFLLQPVHKIWPRLYWALEGKLYRWLCAHCGYWGFTGNYKVVEYGDDISELANARVLVLVNHQTTADVPTMLATLQNKGCAARKALWVMDASFKYTPFGVVAAVHGDHFIKQGKDIREEELERLKQHLESVYWGRDRRWILVFPEGGFLYKRRETSNNYARKTFPDRQELNDLQFVTLPRFGAVRTILSAVGPTDGSHSISGRVSPSEPDIAKEEVVIPQLEQDSRPGEGNNENHCGWREDKEEIVRRLCAKPSEHQQLAKHIFDAVREKKYIKMGKPPVQYVLDVALIYTPNCEQAPGLHNLVLGSGRLQEIAIYYRKFRADELQWDSDDSVREWLYRIWIEKEATMRKFYENGCNFDGLSGTKLNFPYYKIVGHHLFFLVSGYALFKLCYVGVSRAIINVYSLLCT